MEKSRPALSPEERNQLRRFVRLVDEMSRSRFIETYRTQDHAISFGTEDDGASRITAPEYDWEDFRSFLTVFRQVAILQQEPAHLGRILTIIGRYASSELQKKLRLMRKDIFARLDGRYSNMKLGRTVNGKEMSLGASEVLDALVNGMVFHSDPKHSEKVAFLDASERWFYLWPLMFEVITPCLRCFLWLSHAMRREGILEEGDYPVRCLGAKPA